MVWHGCDGDLAGAVSNAGGLGYYGGGNAPKEVVKANIDKVKITDKPLVLILCFCLHLLMTLLILLLKGVKVVTTGAGNPENTWNLPRSWYHCHSSCS